MGNDKNDKLTLDDLRVGRPLYEGLGFLNRPATLDDLVEVLEGMGAERDWLCPNHRSPWYEDEGMCQRAAAATAYRESANMYVDCEEPGTYLVLRLEEK